MPDSPFTDSEEERIRAIVREEIDEESQKTADRLRRVSL